MCHGCHEVCDTHTHTRTHPLRLITSVLIHVYRIVSAPVCRSPIKFSRHLTALGYLERERERERERGGRGGGMQEGDVIVQLLRAVTENTAVNTA
jgi:hypothetical protein